MNLDPIAEEALSRLTAGGAVAVFTLALLVVAARFLN